MKGMRGISLRGFAKALPRVHRFGRVKLDFKGVVSKLPLVKANVANRLASERIYLDANPDRVASLYEEYVKKRYEIDQVR